MNVRPVIDKCAKIEKIKLKRNFGKKTIHTREQRSDQSNFFDGNTGAEFLQLEGPCSRRWTTTKESCHSFLDLDYRNCLTIKWCNGGTSFPIA